MAGDMDILILLTDMAFWVDSILTAVVITVGVMMVAANPLAKVIENNAAMGFSVGVEMLNMWRRKNRRSASATTPLRSE